MLKETFSPLASTLAIWRGRGDKSWKHFFFLLLEYLQPPKGLQTDFDILGQLIGIFVNIPCLASLDIWSVSGRGKTLNNEYTEEFSPSPLLTFRDATRMQKSLRDPVYAY